MTIKSLTATQLLEADAFKTLLALAEEVPDTFSDPEFLQDFLLAIVKHTRTGRLLIMQETIDQLLYKLVTRLFVLLGSHYDENVLGDTFSPLVDIWVDHVFLNSGAALEQFFLFKLAEPTNAQVDKLIENCLDDSLQAVLFKSGYPPTNAQLTAIVANGMWKSIHRLLENQTAFPPELLTVTIVKGQYNLALGMLQHNKAIALPLHAELTPVDSDDARNLKAKLLQYLSEGRITSL